MASFTPSPLDPTSLSNMNGSQTSVAGPSVLESNQHTHFRHNHHFVFSKQFIPVVVLAAFLLLLLVLQLLHFPRILHFSPPIPSLESQDFQDEQHAVTSRQNRSVFSSQETISQYKSFLDMSYTKGKDSRIRLPHNYRYQPAYMEPTIRLVHEYHNRSPEPRVYLPEEITLPTPPSPSLVNTPQPDVFTSNVNIYSPLSRVYFPPGLSEIYETEISDQLQPHQFYEAQHTDDTICEYTAQDSQDIPVLSSSPPAAFTPFYELISVSSDALMPPLTREPFFESSAALLAEKPEPDESYIPPSPELSPPPLIHAHPFLARRALSPWRSRPPPEPIHHKITETRAGDTSNINRHLPSVPSRLRYFITRSAAASLCSSKSNSTPESSLGKRSEKSANTNKSSLKCKDSAAVEPGSDRASGDAGALGRPIGNPETPTSTSTHIPQLQNIRPFSQVTLNEPYSTGSQINVPRRSGDGLCSPQIEINPEQDIDQEILEQHDERERFSFSMSGTTTNPSYRPLLGLGLDLHAIPEPISVDYNSSESSTNLNLSWAEMGTTAVGDHDQGVPQTSLRTVLSRWMSRTRREPAGFAEEGRRRVIARGNNPDDSVEIMVMGRSEGLDSSP